MIRPKLDDVTPRKPTNTIDAPKNQEFQLVAGGTKHKRHKTQASFMTMTATGHNKKGPFKTKEDPTDSKFNNHTYMQIGGGGGVVPLSIALVYIK